MIHLNIGSNLNSKHGSRINNISIAINLLIESKIKINDLSSYTLCILDIDSEGFLNIDEINEKLKPGDSISVQNKKNQSQHQHQTNKQLISRFHSSNGVLTRS